MRINRAAARRVLGGQRGVGLSQDNIRHRVRVTQDGGEIVVQIELSRDAVANTLIVHHPAGDWMPIGTFALVEEREFTGLFEATVSLDDPRTAQHIDSALVHEQTKDEENELVSSRALPLNLYVEVDAPSSLQIESARPSDAVPEGAAADRAGTDRVTLTLGRFTHTELTGLHRHVTQDNEYLIYPTRRGNLALVAGTMPEPFVQVQIDKARIEEGQIVFAGTLFTRHTEPTDLHFSIEGRDTGAVITTPLRGTEDLSHPSANYGHRSYHVSAKVSLREFLCADVSDDVFTVWVTSRPKGSEEIHRARAGVSRYLVRRRANETWAEQDDRSVLVSLYYTFQANNLSINVEQFATEDLRRMIGWIRHPRTRPVQGRGRKPVWLIGEQNYKAQDTGLAFFRFMREQHPEVDAYYVISEHATDRENLADLDHVVFFRSSEHIELFFRAERLIGSHHPEYIYPSKSQILKNSVKTVRVFLQHGVFGVRRLDKLYGRHAPEFHTDLFIVSSEREKRNAITDLGYRADEVAVTGLSRYDTLFDGKTALKPRQVLIMPTWREWLQSEHTFRDSQYLQRWGGLLSSPRLGKILQDNGAEAVLVLHPNMRIFADHFESDRVRMVRQGEESVQNLLKESGVLVTDYSSVGFDFSFLDKPVLYYQFDSRRFLAEGSHIDLDTELPGPITWSQETLLDSLEDTLRRDSRIEPEYARRVDELIAHRDTNNCERIFSAISQTSRRAETLMERNTEIVGSAERIARKQKFYIPVMTRLFDLLRMLPVDDGIVVFEAGRGKQMTDSPKAIYDELVRRGDTRTKVWLYNGKSKIADEHTRVVTRFSPAYFWYLARAKYWVSNQHFPPYLSRRQKGVFLQTWHGTPLKKMMHDHDYVAERDDTLVERYSRAVAQWTHLVSPSPFASRAFASAFRHRAEVVEVGYPRNDSLTAPGTDDLAASTRRKLGVPTAKKVVLYAPTFRDDKPIGGNRFLFDPPFTIEQMAEAIGEDYVLLVRLHGLVKHRFQIAEELADRIIDVTDHSSLNELFLASDALITDYSSVFFDYAVLGRPIVLFAYDLDKYRDELRGFYLDFAHDLPFPIVTKIRDLRSALQEQAGPLDSRTEFLQRFAPNEDGRASQRVVDRIFGSI